MEGDDPFATVAQRLVPGGQLSKRWPLTGGVSAITDALEIKQVGGPTVRVVVRRHRDLGWTRFSSIGAATEFALLEALHRSGMAVPEVHFVDESRHVFPTPYLVMDLVEGTTAVEDALLPGAMRQMATFLAGLHALSIDEADLPTLPELEDPVATLLAETPPSVSLPSSVLGDRLRSVLPELASPPSSQNRSLLHGDFWPGNVLWQDGQIASVIDWEDASLGDPLSDLACCRVELLCRYDEAAMETFTEHYCSLANPDLSRLPLWELYVSSAALASMADWGLEPEDEANRRRKTEPVMERAGRELLQRLE